MIKLKNILNEDKLSDFENLLKSHDWYYDRSDDHSKWKRGSEQRKKILDLKKELGSKADALWNKYKKR